MTEATPPFAPHARRPVPDWLAAVDFSDPKNAYNAFEAAFWVAVAAALAARRTPRRAAGYRWALCGVLVAFGASDVWELHSGAWWTPWPLCVTKFACGGGGSALAVLWWRAERRGPPAASPRSRPTSLP